MKQPTHRSWLLLPAALLPAAALYLLRRWQLSSALTAHGYLTLLAPAGYALLGALAASLALWLLLSLRLQPCAALPSGRQTLAGALRPLFLRSMPWSSWATGWA